MVKEIDSKPGNYKRVSGGRNAQDTQSIKGGFEGLRYWHRDFKEGFPWMLMADKKEVNRVNQRKQREQSR